MNDVAHGQPAPSPRPPVELASDPLWYQDAVIYELHVRAFHDSDGDGIGDFRGLVEKLDYLQELGVTALWLLPFYPSPLKDDGYDIADYWDVHPSYGTLKDFKTFLREAHRRGLRVITELVINHTSDQHPWFQRARKARAGSQARDFYVWSDTNQRFPGVRIIFQDFETSNWSFDHVAGAYFWHRFYHHQPDLNFDNPAVQRAVRQVLDFWLGMGVDGMRLDAVPYLFEREGTNCENLPETHDYLRDLRRHLDRKHRDRMLLAEANMWPEDAVAYFGAGDECHMNFHFPLMPRLFMAIRMEDRFPIIDILKQTPAVPPGCQWALFLRNHDELTLEMVTDQERDYMYRVYAHDARARINLGIRRRLAPLLGNDRRKIELMNSLLFSLPGTPVIYYGDELGMGDNIYLGDRNGVRTPMQWSADRNAGFSRANPQSLYLPVIIDPENHYETVNVETQEKNQHSLLWWMKRLIALRKRYRAFGRGTLDFLYPRNHKVLAYLRRWEEERILVVVNLSRFVQPVELDLAEFEGLVPVELFGRTPFAPIRRDAPYFLTLGPHSFYWFALEPARGQVGPHGVQPEAAAAPPAPELPALAVERSWEELLTAEAGRARLAPLLPAFLRGRRWFRGKAYRMRSAEVQDALRLATAGQPTWIALVHVEYFDADGECYLVPLTAVSGPEAARLLEELPRAALARAFPAGERGRGEAEGGWLLHDALTGRAAFEALLEVIARKRSLRGEQGRLVGVPSGPFRRVWAREGDLTPRVLGVEQSNSSAGFGERLVLKVFRTVASGTNPDLEVGEFLTARGFPHTAQVVGRLEYRRGKDDSMTIGVLQEFVANEGDAWRFTLDALSRFYERALVGDVTPPPPPGSGRPELVAAGVEPLHVPPLAEDLIGFYLEMARVLGQRTAELHLALASDPEDPAFRPEPYPPHAQRSLYQQLRTQLVRAMGLLRQELGALPPATRELADRVLEQEGELAGRLKGVFGLKLDGQRIRVHGDYHLGQVLYTGKDFVIIDFEGEPARSLSERRLKHSALRDVAGMLRSFQYAAQAGLIAPTIRPEDRDRLSPWGVFWYRWVSSVYLRAYLQAAEGGVFLPRDPAEVTTLLEINLIEKVLYELAYELNNRPDWVSLPLQGILTALEGEHPPVAGGKRSGADGQ